MKLFLAVFVLIATFYTSNAVSQTAWRINAEDFEQWLGDMALSRMKPEQQTPNGMFQRLLRAGLEWGGKTMANLGLELGGNTEPYPYFHWIPPYVTSVMPAQNSQGWSAPCFPMTTAVASAVSDNVVALTFSFGSGPTSAGCSDFYLLGTASHATFIVAEAAGTQTVYFNTSQLDTAELWDIQNNGVRVFRFLDDILQSVENLYDTLLLFVPELTMSVPQFSAERNVDFMAKYAGRVMTKRTTQSVSIDPSTINSGDFIGVIRLDGLDPTLAWAMGSTTGHTTVAMRAPDGTLYVAESTVKDSYWPTNGIQITPYATWILQARKAGYQVVHAPLSPENAKLFNATAAWAKFYELQGLDYGYQNMLYGWIDTLAGNYPCVPPSYTQCLQWQHVEILFGLIERVIPFGDMLFLQAFNLRLGTSGLSWAEIIMTAGERGLQMDNLPYIVEEDSWVYQTTRYNQTAVGPSMVCCVFVCNMWKAAGLFGELTDEINCAEQTNFDIYSMNLFDSNAVRPPQCVKADPSNQLCQLEGEYTLNLNGYNTRPLYAHEDEACPSLAPQYSRPANC